MSSMKVNWLTAQLALRLWPLFAVDKRICFEDTVLPSGGGPSGTAPILVAKGTMVTTNLYALHRNKAYWGADADEFKPERWITARPTWEYIPFSGGPRICPAQQLVLTEAGYVLHRLAWAFKGLESRDDTPWMESLKISVRNKHGVQVALIPA
ncbi:hypothetical protein MMC25_007231 [Agyrium rufum]|nr:hypothetical protein [Agyrium rufum]